MSPENPDDGWDDAPEGGGDEGGADDAAPEGGATAEGAPGGEGGRKRRRRRRRRHGERGDQPAQAGGRDVQVGGEASQHRDERQHPEAGIDTSRSVEEQQREQQQLRDRQRQQQRQPQQQRPPQQQQQQQRPRDERGGGGRDDRGGRGRGRDDRRRDRDQRDRDAMRAAQTQEPGRGRGGPQGGHGGRYTGARGHGDAGYGEAAGTLDELEHHNDALQADTTAVAPHTSSRAEVARGSQPAIDQDHDEAPADASVAWGTDDGAPAPQITLAADLPAEPPADDPDPVTFPLVEGPGTQLGSDVASVVGVRFVPAGRISWFDAGDADYTPGERVMVDSERGPRLAWIATAPQRKATRDRGLRRVMRRAHEGDLKGERAGETEVTQLLRVAKDKAAALDMPLKVFRVEKSPGKLLVYYTSDDRLDLRDFVRDVGNASGMRVELRQLGVRDEAKVVGGIGSCGLTLCCTTWLPDFVPVSIKMAKDQGLVLSPTKVSGQCGRLKCCLVYEQAGYAELRKGLPKLGKRVIGARGEGRVVEVDVLRQRVRVSYGPGDTEVVPATEVKPLFPSGNQPAHQQHDEPEQDDE